MEVTQNGMICQLDGGIRDSSSKTPQNDTLLCHAGSQEILRPNWAQND